MRLRKDLALLASVAALVGASCIIGPKHDDPADLAAPPDTDAGADGSFGPFDTSSSDTSSPPDTFVASPDVGKTTDGDAESDTAESDAIGDALRDAADGDAPDAPDPSDVSDAD